MFPFISKNLFSSCPLRRFLTSSSFWLFNQLKETTLGLFITFLLVSKRYFSINSLSPEKQPSRCPHVLTTLVLILFDDGGVESMITKWEKRKTEKNMRCSKRCANELFLCRKTVGEGFIAKHKPSLILLLQWVPVFKKRNLVKLAQ